MKNQECIWSEQGTKDGINYSHAQYFMYNDGGRSNSNYTGRTRDCACRAISIAIGKPYQEVYELIIKYGKSERRTKKIRNKGCSHPRTGVWKETFKKIMNDFGWSWTPTMFIGQGCKVHLRSDELPSGTIICLASRHFVTLIDGVIQDTYDSSRRGSRCVYGYYKKT